MSRGFLKVIGNQVSSFIEQIEAEGQKIKKNSSLDFQVVA